MTLTIGRDRRYARTSSSCNRSLHVRISAPAAPGERPPVNLGFAVDRSGSMAGTKLPLAKEAVGAALGRLGARDRFAIVAYDNVVDVTVPSTPATPAARAGGIEALSALSARGGTDLGGGWLTACGEVAGALTGDTVGRCLLLTDGLANQGIVDPAELRGHAAALRARGVSTSTFGVGDDFDEELLGNLADAGGGNFYFIATADQIPAYVARELGEALTVVAREVVLDVTAPPGVGVVVVGTWPAEATRTGVRIRLPDLVSAQELDVILRVELRAGRPGDRVTLTLALTDADGVLRSPSADVGWEFADDATNDRQPRDVEVDRPVAAQYAALARREASQLNRHGDYAAASDRLAKVARNIRRYAGRDPVLLALCAALEAEAQEHRAPLSSVDRKSRYFASTSALRSKLEDGTSRRR